MEILKESQALLFCWEEPGKKKVQKSEFFQLCSYPTALAEITDIIMNIGESWSFRWKKSM